MRTSSIDSDDEDECLPTDHNEDVIDLNQNKNLKGNQTLGKIHENDLRTRDIKIRIGNKRKCLGNSSFLIKTDGFLKSKKKKLRLGKNDNIKNIKSLDNTSNTSFNKKINSLVDPAEKSDAAKENNAEDNKKKCVISDDIIIKKAPSKSLQISYKRDKKDSEYSSLSTNQCEKNATQNFEISDDQTKRNFDSLKTNCTLHNKSTFQSRVQHYQNLLKIISKNSEVNNKTEYFNSLDDVSVETKNKENAELLEEVSQNLNSKRNILKNKEILHHLNKNIVHKKGVLKDNFEEHLTGENIQNNKFLIERENSENENIQEHKENYLGKKPSLSLTKLKRSASLSDSVRNSKRLKENNLNLENDNCKKNFKDMSVYDRRSTVFGMDNIGERTNISNGLLSRISNEDNSSNNQYYSSSSNLNGQLPQQQPTTIATLCNIGNTCYLNSVVYTLRFAPLFLHNLHHLVDDLSNVNQNIVKYRAKSSSLGRNVSGLHIENARSWSSKDLASLESNSILTGNSGIGGIGLGGIGNFGGNNPASACDNQKSSQQIATEKLHELYQHLHRNEMNDSTEPFHADTFLHAIQDVSAIFEGNQQQDAHEFLMCVLDNIRETCQSLTKAITEYPDVISNGYVGIPEQGNENKTSTSVTTQSNVVVLPKEPLQQINNVSNTTNLMKTSFFSRKSKRKDEAKNSKNIKTQSKESKDNSSSSNFSASLDSTDASNSNSAFPSNLLGTSILENDISNTGNSGKNISTAPGAISQKDNKEHLAEKIKKLGLDFFSQYFEGITVSTTKCLSCETITEQKETMIDIAVPISGYENADCSGSFIQNSCITREYFRGENKYRCEQCTGYTEAIRSISYEVLPRLLIIQLSRFSGGMEKINSYLPTPFTLQCFCSQCCKANDEDKLHIYKLYSVITHVGATMSVGHYIAYTCSLDWSNEYINCPKDRRRQQQTQQFQQQQQQQNKLQNLSSSNKTSFSSNTNNSHINLSNGSSSSGNEKNMGIVKKLIYGRSKASSSGDMTKNMKNLNGISSSTKDITNGVEKLKMGPTLCQGLNCCGIKLRQNNLNYSSNSLNNLGASSGIGSINSSSVSSASNLNGSYVDLIDDINTNANSNINSGHNSGYGSMNGSRNYHHRQQHQHQNEPIWYMCDDDKIKAMTQREFEELLSPNRKIMITPYLLFYARKNLNKNDSTNDINSDCRNGSDE
ncbi:ubiquitin carboxyl-terminal hydrolase 1 isoform X2 [Condylostylus longicornis]|uniref:ubiquitin carboxyl-terminal hydrolase 1 isoform X2 n=1 Tax=Condylostylus longicornis TaxID=2530218 RepID=UPI00244E4786|nr:ubiquitin carboxyl-terminal hydrolase 1 isoform X2 [Condylostylus longicornis]